MEKLGIGSQVEHGSFGHGVIVEIEGNSYTIYFTEEGEVKEINKEYEGLSVHEKVAPEIPPIEIKDIELALNNILKPKLNPQQSVEIASKWEGGHLEMVPGNPELQSKEIPIDTFFHKIIMVREKLRVLEQNINNHDSLNQTEKLHLEQYITRVYGSLTTFNVLFANKEDQFKGAGKR